MGMVVCHPLGKPSPINSHGVGVLATPSVDELAIVVRAMQDGIGYGNGADGVVGKAILVGEQREVVVVCGVEFPMAAYYIANDCA